MPRQATGMLSHVSVPQQQSTREFESETSSGVLERNRFVRKFRRLYAGAMPGSTDAHQNRFGA
eukprot:CAMPEP_0198513456 /NCGR_PEP_ID=MMETSP1462-20131121/16076_1 /TAXON_ID=1333877 /ORGANISM="Brandtodinium nutriculum, Strain RCC3387" /LENGTH=62 /DNA_ID=CAMNT_0044242883 /DNA_START=42 /DNA_END=226 /DNA_ORIENTATION=+